MKKILVSVFLLIIVLCLTSCANKEIDFKVSYDNMAAFGHKKIDDKYYIFNNAYITSQEQLIALCDEWNNKSFDKNNEYYYSEEEILIRSYDDEYFELNNLIIIEFETAQGIYTKIKNINIEEHKIIVNIKQKQKNGIWTTEAFRWLMIVEVSKGNTNGVTELVVNIKK